jgi:hypothetical protein
MNILLIALLTATLQTSPSQTTLRGLVTSATDGAPLSDAGVELVGGAREAPRKFTVATESDGSFTFEGIPPGDYHIAATRAGFIRGEYGQRGRDGKGLTVSVKAGDTLKDIRIALTQTGVIAGRILDRHRMPIPNVQVQALRFMNMGSLRFVETVGVATTNDLGEYRIFWLPPDDYFVMAMPIRGSLDDELIKTDGSGNAFIDRVRPAAGSLILAPTDIPPLPFFFQDSNEPRTATRITLAGGETLRAVDITIQPVPTFSIKGKVTNVPAAPAVPVAGRPGLFQPGIELRLEPRKDPEIRFRDSMPGGLISLDSKSEAFVITGVLPGSYWVFARAFGNEAKVPVDIVSKDVEGVSISFVAGFDVPLKITVEGTDDASIISRVIDSVELGLNAEDQSGGPNAEQVRGQPRGSLMARNVTPGSYTVGWTISGNPPGYFKSVRIDGVDVRGFFRLDRTPLRPIEVVFGISTGVITGIVVDDKLAPASDVTVVAIGPKGSRYATTGPDGRFRITEAPPGDYRVYAWEAIKLYSWQDPEVMRRDGGKGISVRVEDGAAVTVSPTLIPATGTK